MWCQCGFLLDSHSYSDLSSGAAGMDFRKACQAMLDGITLAVKELQPMSLSLIHIVIFKQNVFQAFRSVFHTW